MERLEDRQLMSASPWTFTGYFYTDPTHYDTVYRAGNQFDFVNQANKQSLGQLSRSGQLSLTGTSLLGSFNAAQTRILWNNDTVWEKAGSAADWFDNNLADWNLRGIVETRFYAHGGLNRQDMLDIFARAESEGTVNATEFNTLRSLVNNAAALKTPDYVRDLASKVVLGDPANSTYAGYLNVGSSSQQLQLLVGQWFLGRDRPAIGAGDHYVFANGPLYSGNRPNFWDVQQGAEGDCYYLATLAETALQKPADIASMFINNGDGTYTVRFYDHGTADYLTVDRALPVDSAGNYVYDGLGLNSSSTQNSIWVELAEKAYAQENASGWFGQGGELDGKNSYDAIGQGGWPAQAIAEVTGLSATGGTLSFNNTVNQFNSGHLVVVASNSANVDSYIETGHAYAFIGYDASTQDVTLFNPWGLNGGYGADGNQKSGYFYMPWSNFAADFGYSGNSLATAVQLAHAAVTMPGSDLHVAAPLVTQQPVESANASATTAAIDRTSSVQQQPVAAVKTSPAARRTAAVDELLAGWDSLIERSITNAALFRLLDGAA
jgi:hypothetical protein